MGQSEGPFETNKQICDYAMQASTKANLPSETLTHDQAASHVKEYEASPQDEGSL